MREYSGVGVSNLTVDVGLEVGVDIFSTSGATGVLVGVDTLDIFVGIRISVDFGVLVNTVGVSVVMGGVFDWREHVAVINNTRRTNTTGALFFDTVECILDVRDIFSFQECECCLLDKGSVRLCPFSRVK